MRRRQGTWDSRHKSSTITVSGDVVSRTNDGGSNSRSVITQTSVRAGRGSGKWRLKIVAGPAIVGVATTSLDAERWLGATSASWGYDGSDGQKCHGGQWASYAVRFNTGDEVTVEVANTSLKFYKNGSAQPIAYTNLSGVVHAAVSLGQGRKVQMLGFDDGSRSGASPGRRTGSSELWDPAKKSHTIEIRGATASRVASGDANSHTVLSKNSVSTGTHTWKIKMDNGAAIVGIGNSRTNVDKWLGADANSYGYDGSDGQRCHISWSSFARGFGAGSTVSITVNMNSRTVTASVDGRSAGTLATGLGPGPWHAGVSLSPNRSATITSGGETAPAAADTRRGSGAGAAQAGSTTSRDTFDSSHMSSTMVLSHANATAKRTGAGTNSRIVMGKTSILSGTAEWQVKVSAPCIIGVCNTSASVENYLGSDRHGWGYDGSDGQASHAGSWKSYSQRFASGDVITVQVDLDSHSLTFKKNGSQMARAHSNVHGPVVLAIAMSRGTEATIQAFSYRGSIRAADSTPAFTTTTTTAPSTGAGSGAGAVAPATAVTTPAAGAPTEFQSTMSYAAIQLTGPVARMVQSNTGNSRTALAAPGVSSGRHAWEISIVTHGVIVGVGCEETDTATYLGAGRGDYGYDGRDGQLAHNGSWSHCGMGFGPGSKVQIVLDLDADTLEFIVSGSTDSRPIKLHGALRGRKVYPGVSLSSQGNAASIMKISAPAAAVAPVAAPTVEPGVAALKLLQGAVMTAEYVTALNAIEAAAEGGSPSVSWSVLTSAVQAKRASATFDSTQWSSEVARQFGGLLRKLKSME